MKSILRPLAFLFFITAASVTFASPVDHPVPVKLVSSKYANLFILKIDREFRKSLVEIYYSDGDLVATYALTNPKMIINFCDVKPGTYTIRIKKYNRVQEYQFRKK